MSHAQSIDSLLATLEATGPSTYTDQRCDSVINDAAQAGRDLARDFPPLLMCCRGWVQARIYVPNRFPSDMAGTPGSSSCPLVN